MPDQIAPSVDGMRILVVDDHLSYRRTLRSTLNAEPDMVVLGEASDGEEAIRLAAQLRREGLNLVLMDIDLPGMSGVDATARITAVAPDLPVIMLTVSTLDRDLFDAVRVGAVGFLSKNLTPSSLVESLRNFHRDRALPMSLTMASKVLAYFQGRAGRAPSRSAVELVLTARELEVLQHIARGARDREIAQALVVTESTVKKHVQSILRKLHVRNRAEAAARL
jgi:two-component system NarL family response regulator